MVNGTITTLFMGQFYQTQWLIFWFSMLGTVESMVAGEADGQILGQGLSFEGFDMVQILVINNGSHVRCLNITQRDASSHNMCCLRFPVSMMYICAYSCFSINKTISWISQLLMCKQNNHDLFIMFWSIKMYLFGWQGQPGESSRGHSERPCWTWRDAPRRASTSMSATAQRLFGFGCFVDVVTVWKKIVMKLSRNREIIWHVYFPWSFTIMKSEFLWSFNMF